MTLNNPLAGVWAKIERADENIRSFNSEIKIYEDNYLFVSKPNNEATRCVLMIKGPEPPLRFSVILGEIVHQLRSSLNLLINALVMKNGYPVTKNHEFPICQSWLLFKDACKRGKIEGVSSAAKKMIWFSQPYRRSTNPKNNFLYILRELSNSDKHRNLIALYTQNKLIHLLTVSGFTSTKSGETIGSIIVKYNSKNKGTLRPTEEGTEAIRIIFPKPQPDF